MSHNYKSVGNPRSITVNPTNSQLGYNLRAFWGKDAADPKSDPIDILKRQSDGTYSVIGSYVDIDKAGMYFYDGNVITPYLSVESGESVTYGLYTVDNNGVTGELIDLYKDYFVEINDVELLDDDFVRVFSTVSEAALYDSSVAGNIVYAKDTENEYIYISGDSSNADGVYIIAAQNSLQLQMINGGMFQDDATINVGSTGSFAEVADALDAISSCVAKIGVTVTINMLAGYEFNKTVILDNSNLGFVSIIAADSSVPVNSSLSSEVAPSFFNDVNSSKFSDLSKSQTGKYLFYINGGLPPRFNFNFEYLGIFAQNTIVNISDSLFTNMYVGDSGEISSCYAVTNSIVTSVSVDVSGIENAVFLNCDNIPTLTLDADMGDQSSSKPFFLLALCSNVSCGSIGIDISGQTHTAVSSYQSTITINSNLGATAYNGAGQDALVESTGSSLTIKNFNSTAGSGSASVICDLNLGSFITATESTNTIGQYEGASAFNTVSLEGCVWHGS